MTLDELTWGSDGLLPVTIVDARSGDVLTLAYANREAAERTIATQQTHLYSRSRQELWRKGETSGNTQHVVAIDADCDGDALVYRVVPAGPACHTGNETCFFNHIFPADESAARADETVTFADAVTALDRRINERRRSAPEGSYTAALFAAGTARIAQKVGEEAVETVVAAVAGDRAGLVSETADLVYHTLVLLAEREVTLDEVGRELARRASPAR